VNSAENPKDRGTGRARIKKALLQRGAGPKNIYKGFD